MSYSVVKCADITYSHYYEHCDDDKLEVDAEAAVSKVSIKANNKNKKSEHVAVAADIVSAHAHVYANNDELQAGANAGVAKTSVEAGPLSAGANLLNASAEVKAGKSGVGAMARAELASVSAGVGPLKIKAGVGIDTGIKAGEDGIQVKFLGTGLVIGPKPSVAVGGSEVECAVM